MLNLDRVYFKLIYPRLILAAELWRREWEASAKREAEQHHAARASVPYTPQHSAPARKEGPV